MQALFDGDIIVFRCGLAAERNVWHLAWNPDDEGKFQDYKVFEYKKEAIDHLDRVCPGVYSREDGEDYRLWPEVELEPLSHALHNVKVMMSKCLDAVGCTEFDAKVYFSDKRNFRYDVAKTRPYKGNRDKARRPTYEDEIRQYIKENWDTYTGDYEEADDLLGIAQTKYGPEGSVIISIDKDLDQIPGLKYNFMHDVRYNITEEQAIYNFHIQLMTGDSTDNIPGLPGVGPAKAAKALHGLETQQEQFDEVCRMYQIKSGKEDWQEYLIEQARLVWIRRVPGEMWEHAFTGFEPSEWDATELTLEVS